MRFNRRRAGARNTWLERNVAIKILPAQFSSDPAHFDRR